MLFGYVIHSRAGVGDGMRVHDDGRVELSEDGGWGAPVTRLDETARNQLIGAVRASGILALPDRTPAPPNVKGGDTVQLFSDVGRGVDAYIDAWDYAHPAAVPSLQLVMTLSRLVTAAQAG